VLGVNNTYPDSSVKPDPEYSMRRFLTQVGVQVDLDGDGDLELPYVDGLDFYRLVETGEDPKLTAALDAVVTGIENEITFDSVTLVPTGDEHGLISEIRPARITGLSKGDTVRFEVVFRGVVPAVEHDQVFRMGLNVLTDDEDLAAYQDIVVLVPGRQE